MASKAIKVTVDMAGFRSTETFMSETDAQAWQEMLETTLKCRDKVTFDLTVYAAGLADTARPRRSVHPRQVAEHRSPHRAVVPGPAREAR